MPMSISMVSIPLWQIQFFTESPTTLTKNTLQCLHRIQSSTGTRSQKQEKTDPTTQML
jgi:hypothetical protein